MRHDWLARSRAYDVEGGGAGGGGTPAADPGVPADTVKKLIETFENTMKTVARPAAPAPAAPVSPDPSTTEAERKARYDAARKKANDTAATGDFAGALEILSEHARTEQSRNQRPVTDDPVFKAGSTMARKIAESTHKTDFEKYGTEIESYMAKMPPEKRIDPSSYDEAVRYVRAQHLDDIVKDRVEEAVRAAEAARREEEGVEEEEDEGGGGVIDRGYRLPPTSRPGRGRERTADPTVLARRLTAEQRGVAKSLDLTPEEYAKALLSQGGREVADGRVNVPILNEKPGEKIAPGKF